MLETTSHRNLGNEPECLIIFPHQINFTTDTKYFDGAEILFE